MSPNDAVRGLPANGGLMGRDALIRRLRAMVDRGESVLLYGPSGIGKSAIIPAVARPGLHVVDPFEGLSARRSAAIRRSLARGDVWLAAASSLDRRRQGAVRRIAWQFTVVTVPPLPPRHIRDIMAARLGASVPAGRWFRRASTLIAGRPGIAEGMATVVAERWRTEGRWPSPEAAFISARVRDYLDLNFDPGDMRRPI